MTKKWKKTKSWDYEIIIIKVIYFTYGTTWLSNSWLSACKVFSKQYKMSANNFFNYYSDNSVRLGFKVTTSFEVIMTFSLLIPQNIFLELYKSTRESYSTLKFVPIDKIS